MRVRLCSWALLGAGLAAAQEFKIWTRDDKTISHKLIPTAKDQPLELRYQRSTAALGPPSSVTITLHMGNPYAPISSYEWSPGLKQPKGPVPPNVGPYGMTFNEAEATPTAGGFVESVNGTINIKDPAGIAISVSSSSSVPPPRLYFTIALNQSQSKRGRILGSRQVPNQVEFGLANPDVSRNEAAMADFPSRMFGDDGTLRQPPSTDIVTTSPPPPSTFTTTVDATTVPTTATSASGTARATGNGLSTGAIAGIAVGAGIVVLLLGTILAWLFMRRRRENKAANSGLGYDGGPGKSGDLVAEKEANTIVAESPRSPYSEDGPLRDSVLVGGGSAASSGAAGLIAAHHHDRDHDVAGDYAPYSDHPSASNAPQNTNPPVARAGSPTSRSTADRSSAAFPLSSVPPPAIGEEGLPPRADTGMSGRYAHLVEDGMTPAEIARLEEEEHQLDVAIEQARGVTTK